MVDSDLAQLYEVETKRLNQQVRRNQTRFPADFVFQLTADERSEVVANCNHLRRLKFSPTLPLAFTEHGAVMAASVLNTAKAIQTSVYVVRAFVHMREAITRHKEIAARLVELERRVARHDTAIGDVVSALRQLMNPPQSVPRPIGSVTDGPKRGR